MRSSTRATAMWAIVGLAPGLALFLVSATRSITHTACIEEMLLDVANAAGILLGVGAAPVGILARVLHGLRPRPALGVVCKGLGASNLLAAAGSAAALLYTWYDGDPRDAAPVGLALVVCSIVGIWLVRGASVAPPTGGAGGWRRWAWLLLGAATLGCVAFVSVAIWAASHTDDLPIDVARRQAGEATLGFANAATFGRSTDAWACSPWTTPALLAAAVELAGLATCRQGKMDYRFDLQKPSATVECQDGSAFEYTMFLVEMCTGPGEGAAGYAVASLRRRGGPELLGKAEPAAAKP